MAVHIPVQAAAGVVEDPVDGLAGSRGGGEQRRSGQGLSIRGEEQVAVARKNAHVIGVFVERMLPASLPDDPQQNHVRPDACADCRCRAGADTRPHSWLSMSSGIERPLIMK